MPILFDGPVTPDALTTFVREVPQPRNTRLTQLFGAPRTNQTNTVDFAEIVRTNRTAKYRTYDGRIHVSQRDAGSARRVPLAPLSSSLSEGEYERLQREFARLQGGNQAALAEAVYNDAENLTNEVLNRLELAWGDVLTDGKLSINEGGLSGTAGEADYGVPASQIITVGTAWNAGTGTITPYSDLLAACDVYNANNGFLPGSMLPSLKQVRTLQKSTEIINAVAGAQTGRTRVSRAELNEFLQGEGLPTLLDPFDEMLDVDGVSTRVIPEDRLVFFPPNIEDLGHTEMGVSATALELVQSNESDFSFEDAPGIVGVIEKVGPPYRQFTFVDAVGQPVLSNAKYLMVMDVLN